MDENHIARWIAEALNGVRIRRSWGEAAWCYNPGGMFANVDPFITISDAGDGWRLSFAATAEDFETLFDPTGPRAAPGRDGWVAVRAPSRRAFERLQPALRRAHRRARERYERRFRNAGRAA